MLSALYLKSTIFIVYFQLNSKYISHYKFSMHRKNNILPHFSHTGAHFTNTVKPCESNKEYKRNPV